MIQIGGVYIYIYIFFFFAFCQWKGILLQKYRIRNGRCIAILFKNIGVRGRSDSPEEIHANSDGIFLGISTEIHHDSGVSAFCANYDGFLWIFLRNGGH